MNRKCFDFYSLDCYLVVRKIPIIRKVYYFLQWREKKIHFGGNEKKDETYYVIRINPEPKVGVFAYYRYVLGKIMYALEHNYIPVVDMMNYRNMYINWPNHEKNNSWELFFEQPSGIGVEDIKNCHNVVLSSLDMYERGMNYNSCSPTEALTQLANTYIRFSPKVKELIHSSYDKLLSNRGKVCGIKLRGSDYAISKFTDHAIPPTSQSAYEEIVHIVDDVWNEHFDAYFLSTEDESILNYFRERMGDNLIFLPISRYSPNEIWYNSEMSLKQRVNEGYDYCIDIALLAKCDSLITTICQGAGAASIINGKKYNHVHIITRGVY